MNRRIAAIPPSLARAVTCTAVLTLTSGCYSGLALQPEEGAAFDTDDPDAPGDRGDDGDDGGADDTNLPESFEPDPGQIRLLSAHEYRNTVRDLLGVEASPDLDFSDLGSGYDSGSNGQLGESLFSILYLEAERIAHEYVAAGLAQDFPCFDPAALSEECVRTVIAELGGRAFRRPVDTQTQEQLAALVDTVTADADGPVHVMEILVTRLLLSPRFLYRTELGTNSPDQDWAVLDAFERASLISYTLTGSMPDTLLLADAHADRLDAERIREHVHRLLDTDAGRAQMVRFFGQWLRVGELDAMAREPEAFAKLTSAALGTSLRDEFGTFIERTVVEDGATFSELLTRNVTYADRHTAPLYGASSASEELEALELDPTQRGGVLTLASVMAVHASGAEVERDKPIRRGLLVVNQLLCEEIGLPSGVDVQSAAAGVIDEVEDFDAMTTREQFELIMNQDEACVACHAQFMPYGYLWSNFDALGQYQTHFGDRPLDAAVDGLVVDGDPGNYGGIMDLVPALAQSDQVSRCFGTQVLRYATGNKENNTITALADQLSPALKAEDIAIVELFEEVLANPALYVREAH